MLIRAVLRRAALAALLLPSVSLAQSPPPAAPSAATQAAVEQRIRTLQTQLGITEAQMPLWEAFAQAMRDNAASTDALFAQRAGSVAMMNAVDNMHSYAQIARAYADNTERLASAFDSLYATLTDTQKKAADTLFRQQATAAAQPRSRR
jgi:protein CpxP